MKRTSRQYDTNNHEQTRCEFHRVKKLNNERKYNHQPINNFENMYR
jgi:hypothetical protein